MNRKQRRAANSQRDRLPQAAPAEHDAYALAAAVANAAAREHAAGRFAQAEDLYRQALARNPALVGAHLNLGQLQGSQGRIEDAVASYLRAIELAPERMDAHNDLCALLLAQSRHAAVAAHIGQVLAFKPDYAPGYNTLAAALLGAGDPAHALEAVLKGIALTDSAEGRALFVACVQGAGRLPDSPALRALLVRAMVEPWGRSSDLTRQAIGLIMADPGLAADVAAANTAWPERLPAARLHRRQSLAEAARNSLLRALLENARSDDIALERYLCSARLALLEATAASGASLDIDADILAFHAALARQCFINEYVYPLTDGEREQSALLQAAVERALRAGERIPALSVAALAAYRPLHRLADAARLLDRDWPASVAALLVQQIRQPADERRIAAAMPRLTPIDDAVSMLVQAQYEENPYPRWVKAAPAGRPLAIDARLRRQFPGSRLRGTGPSPEVLVAGCGTGQQLVDVAQRIAGCRVLAIDLSCASLAYAKRQTDALGIANIEYGQADILKLGALGRRFDVIDCGGVLHHLADPLEGWRVLLSLLKPNGVMRIALYSELARAHVVAARALVARGGYGRGADDIRRFRQDVLALPDGALARKVAESPDFFSVSDCRDLVFHVQEHRFTLPQIKAFLVEQAMDFLGFEIDLRVLGRYSARYPQDVARTDLDGWHAFELENPWTFGGMYQFWLQPRAPA